MDELTTVVSPQTLAAEREGVAALVLLLTRAIERIPASFFTAAPYEVVVADADSCEIFRWLNTDGASFRADSVEQVDDVKLLAFFISVQNGRQEVATVIADCTAREES